MLRCLKATPFTFPEVQTLLDGVTVGGRKISDQDQVLNLAESAKRLLAMVKSGQFELSKPVFTELNGIVARKESLEWGMFRGEGQETNYSPNVGLGEYGSYTPLPTLPGAPELNRVFSEGVSLIGLVTSPVVELRYRHNFGVSLYFFGHPLWP